MTFIYIYISLKTSNMLKEVIVQLDNDLYYN